MLKGEIRNMLRCQIDTDGRSSVKYQDGESVTAASRSYHQKKSMKDLLRTSYGVRKYGCFSDAEVSEKMSELKSGALQAEVQSAKFPCLHSGRVYQDGEEFSSNATDLQAQKPNQCIHCICKTGLVLCRLKNCDSLHCFSSDTKECCPSCKGLTPGDASSSSCRSKSVGGKDG
ncbi:chordin-like protein 1 [Trichonephila clavipes]|uniref:Chordin-like protein 1 n=1 Tax=Trichonephila clavipes TaxID=2585209 RepID=A0A8X6S1S2_TRICX|nr:chordin-like protein 1 [Trichonephila clavipes]